MAKEDQDLILASVDFLLPCLQSLEQLFEGDYHSASVSTSIAPNEPAKSALVLHSV